MFKKILMSAAAFSAALAMSFSGVDVANAYQATNGGWSPNISNNTGNTSATTSLPSGLTVTVAVSGTDLKISDTTITLADKGGIEADFLGGTVPSAGGIGISTWCTTSCVRNTLQTDRGVLTISYSRPVTDPVINVSGVGGDQNNTTNGVLNTMNLWSELELTTANTSLELLNSNGNLEVVNGGTYLRPKNAASYNCHMLATAGCGSVMIKGTGTTFSFKVHYNSANGTLNNQITEDQFVLTMAMLDDYGSAPASYDTSITSNMLSDLYMGAGVTADALTVMNATLDPLGDTETSANSSYKVYPNGVPAPGLAGSTYTLNVPVTGSQAGKVCGWVDWNGGGTFANDSVERRCVSFASGTSTVALSWVVPTGTTYTSSWVRLRASYGTADLSAVGRIDNGEIEDYTIAAVQLAPPVATPQTINVQQFGSGVFTKLFGAGGLTTAGTGTITNSLTCLVNPANSTCGTTLTTTDGTYTLNLSTGVVTYVNNGTAPQTAVSITYRVTDSRGQTATSTLTPVITPPTPPTARPQTITVQQSTSGTFTQLTGTTSLTTRGTAPLTGALSCLVDPATMICGTSVDTTDGRYELNVGTGVVTYTNNGALPAGGTGIAISYDVTDAAGITVSSTLTPIITATPPPPTPPIATAETITVAQGGTGTFSTITGSNGLAAQGSGALTPSLTCLRAPLAPLVCATTVTTTDGTFTLDRNTGIVTYVNNVTAPTTAVSVSYDVTDVNGLTAAASLTPVITPALVITPTPPVVTPPSVTPAPVVTPNPPAVEPTPPVQPEPPVVPEPKPMPMPTAQPDLKRGVQNRPIQLVPVANDLKAIAPLIPTTIKLCSAACAEMPNLGSAGSAKAPVKTAQGTWAVSSSTGAVTFTPVKNWFGKATIHYAMVDELGNPVKSTLTVIIPKPKLPKVLAYTGDGPAVAEMGASTPENSTNSLVVVALLLAFLVASVGGLRVLARRRG